jgi:hypothetical protein
MVILTGLRQLELIKQVGLEQYLSEQLHKEQS